MNTKSFLQNLKCPICWSVPEDPHESDCCGHLFCNPCIRLLSDKRCPICRKEDSVFKRNAFAKKLLLELKVTCNYGCSELVSISKMKDHRLQCSKAVFKCNVDSCKFSGVKSDFGEHYANFHPLQIMILAEHYDKLKYMFDKFDSLKQGENGTISNNQYWKDSKVAKLHKNSIHGYIERSKLRESNLTISDQISLDYFDEHL